MRIRILLLFLMLLEFQVNGQWVNLVSNYSFTYSDLSIGKNTSFFKEPPVQYAKNEKNNPNDSVVDRRNSLYVELLGNNLIYSVGYQRILISRENYNLELDVGFSTNLYIKKPYFAFGFPISINNRFKFSKLNGLDLGVDLGNRFNIWTIQNKEKYYTPYSIPNPPVELFPGIHVGWTFSWEKFTFSPRIYVLVLWKYPQYIYPHAFRIIPYIGFRGCYYF